MIQTTLLGKMLNDFARFFVKTVSKDGSVGRLRLLLNRLAHFVSLRNSLQNVETNWSFLWLLQPSACRAHDYCQLYGHANGLR